MSKTERCPTLKLKTEKTVSSTISSSPTTIWTLVEMNRPTKVQTSWRLKTSTHSQWWVTLTIKKTAAAAFQPLLTPEMLPSRAICVSIQLQRVVALNRVGDRSWRTLARYSFRATKAALSWASSPRTKVPTSTDKTSFNLKITRKDISKETGTVKIRYSAAMSSCSHQVAYRHSKARRFWESRGWPVGALSERHKWAWATQQLRLMQTKTFIINESGIIPPQKLRL